MNKAMTAVRFDHVDVVFGPRAADAVALLDQGQGRDAILDKTNCLIAVHDASVFVNEGEILVLMGLSGSGKSSLLRCINGLNTVTRGIPGFFEPNSMAFWGNHVVLGADRAGYYSTAPLEKTLVSAHSYYLLQSTAAARKPEVQEFVAWLRSEIETDTGAQASAVTARARDSAVRAGRVRS